jgi:predicted glycogen debranching enzyme
MIKLDKSICNDLKASMSREWLESNGIGGFASGTVSGAGTRRYHCLLTAATRPPLGRIRTVSKIEEKLVIDGESFELSTNQYPNTVYPEGYKFISEFKLDPFPTWRYEINGAVLEKKIFMVHGSNSTVCRWTIDSSALAKSIQLEVRPLLAFVDYHQLQHEDKYFKADILEKASLVSVTPDAELPEVYFGHNAVSMKRSGHWYNNFEYAIERERGFDFTEDLFQPFVMNFDLSSPAGLVISTEQIPAKDVEKLERAEIKRRSKMVSTANGTDEFTAQLVLAADQFIVKRGEGHTVIAGYPWFSDWGRDTMISLAGLTLATNRPKIAKDILLEFSKYISEGMLPNRFPDQGESAEYNTVDATLWYFEAVRAYVAATGDDGFVRKQLYSKLSEIITWHLRGTRYNIHVDTDGLLYAGETGVQLTWMDAKVGEQVITPRTGKAVEIQALWYNALRIMSELAERFGHDEDSKRFNSMADLAKLSFNALFWNDTDQCLYDVVENGNRDAAIRPNQIFAVSLAHPIVNDDRAKAVVDKVEAELLTKVGLRSLAPRDPNYIPYYIGSPLERDSAYHEGTVWGWLIGGFIDAYRRVYPDREGRVKEIIEGFRSHLIEAGVGQISEIFDAEWPHSPRGCPAQAWSVAELLRVMRPLDDRLVRPGGST